MSRFLRPGLSGLAPYTPGEQPRDMEFVKLNTNESPFPPSAYAQRLARQAAGDLNLYCDPQCTALRQAASEVLGVGKDRILFSNGSDEVIAWAFQAFCDADTPAVLTEITYGFYSSCAALYNVPVVTVPLRDDFTVDIRPLAGAGGTVFLANPNAQTGIAVGTELIRNLVSSDPDRLVIVDEAYVGFGAASALCLTEEYSNLLIIRTLSKSHSMAGARLGIAIGDPQLISDLEKIRCSFNPYNINRLTQAAGIGALLDTEYCRANCATVASNREYTANELRRMGFRVLPSSANFLLASPGQTDAGSLYRSLRSEGVLVRHFDSPGLRDWIRVTVGTREQMDTFLAKTGKILGEKS